MSQSKLKSFEFWILCFGFFIAIMNPGEVLASGFLQPIAQSNIAHVWANEGGDKVTRDELRAAESPPRWFHSPPGRDFPFDNPSRYLLDWKGHYLSLPAQFPVQFTPEA